MINKPYARNEHLPPSTLLIQAVPDQNKCIHINAIILSTLLFAFEILICVMYGLFMRYPLNEFKPDLWGVAMVFFCIILTIVGFGLLLTYIRSNSWSGMGYTLFILAITLQLYFLVQVFWTKAQIQPSDVSFANSPKPAHIGLTNFSSLYGSSFINAIGCAIAVYVSYSVFHGLVGPLQTFVHTVITVIAYELNRQVLVRIGCMDNGGSMGIYVFGSVNGIVISAILGIHKLIMASSNPKFRSQRINYTYAILGSLFIWCLLPAFHSAKALSASGAVITSPFVSTAAMNTWFALSASVWAVFCTSIIVHKKVGVVDVIFGSFSGGVAYASSSNLVVNPAAPLVVGILAGILSVYFQSYLRKYINRGGILDSNGSISTFMLSGFQGGMWAAIFSLFLGQTQYYTNGFTPYNPNISPSRQGGLQIAGVFISAGIGAISGLISVGLIRGANRLSNQDLFDDGTYWTIEDDGLHLFYDRPPQQPQF